ncbi:MAG TPA: hypothetical protein VES36_05250 [Candidatus Limnocylindrales bacterium]|nr:hypothetical protein [Candidatus Limnocylindrales bacterium]
MSALAHGAAPMHWIVATARPLAAKLAALPDSAASAADCYQQARGVDAFAVHQADVVGPEHVAWQFAQADQNARDGGWRAGGVGVARVAHDAQQAHFGERAGGPALLALARKPVVRRVVLHMRGVDQRDQHIDVEQVACH